jgi:hypothetical protein
MKKAKTFKTGNFSDLKKSGSQFSAATQIYLFRCHYSTVTGKVQEEAAFGLPKMKNRFWLFFCGLWRC